MKVKRTIRKICIVVLVGVMFLCSLLNAYAYTDVADLPHVSRWVNGKAAAEDGTFLYDTWAIDDTNVSEVKYVLLDQEALETMRIEKYPNDISNGKNFVCPIYYGNFNLELPESVSGEVILTFENDDAVYHVYFNEENSYKVSTKFLPGTYSLSEIDVVTDPNGSYSLSKEFTFTVLDKDISATLEVVNVQATEGTDALSSSADNKNGDVATTKAEDTQKASVTNFDKNGDLLGDTVKLCIAVGAVLVVYAFIKRKREKAEELKR